MHDPQRIYVLHKIELYLKTFHTILTIIELKIELTTEWLLFLSSKWKQITSFVFSTHTQSSVLDETS